MGAAVKRSTGGRRHRPMGEINVTPFVDVMLVLLIIFMVTAPLLTVGVQVDLPESSADSLPEEAEPLTLTINSKGEILATMDADLQDNPKEIYNLIKELEKGYDVVSGWKKNRKAPLEKKIASKIFNFFVIDAFIKV